MAFDKEIREELPEDAVVFDNPAFDHSIVGTSTDGAVIYDYDLMVHELMQDDGMDEVDAMEFIDFNTIRSIPYAYSLGVPPIVMTRLLGDITDDCN